MQEGYIGGTGYCSQERYSGGAGYCRQERYIRGYTSHSRDILEELATVGRRDISESIPVTVRIYWRFWLLYT
jgi:hypothetical protein